jgi:hypothetical protein
MARTSVLESEEMADRREYHKQRRAEQKAKLKELKDLQEKQQREPMHAPVVPTVPTVPEHIEQVTEQGRTLEEWALRYREPLRVLAAFATVLAIVCITLFLVREQMGFYVSKGYSTFDALFISLICELVVILLSFYTATQQGWRKAQSGILLAATVTAVLWVIAAGVQRKQSQDESQGEIIGSIKKEIESLERLKADSRPDTWSGLNKKWLNAERELRKQLESSPTVTHATEEFYALAVIRILAMFWNILFSATLARLFRGAGQR